MNPVRQWTLGLITFLCISTNSFCMEEKRDFTWECGRDTSQLFNIKFKKEIKRYDTNHDGTILVVHFANNTLQLFDLTKGGAPIWNKPLTSVMSYKVCPYQNIIVVMDSSKSAIILKYMKKDKKCILLLRLDSFSLFNQNLSKLKEQYAFSHDGKFIIYRKGTNLYIDTIGPECYYDGNIIETIWIWDSRHIDDFYVFPDKNIVAILFDSATKLNLYDIAKKGYLWKEPLEGHFKKSFKGSSIDKHFCSHESGIFIVDSNHKLHCYNLQKKEVWSIPNVAAFRLSQEGDMIAVKSKDKDLQLYRLNEHLEKDQVWEESIKNVKDFGAFSSQLDSIVVLDDTGSMMTYDLTKERRRLWDKPIGHVEYLLNFCFDLNNNNNFIAYIQKLEKNLRVFHMCDLHTKKHIISIDNPFAVGYSKFYHLVSSKYEILGFMLPQKYVEELRDEYVRKIFLKKEKESLQIEPLSIQIKLSDVKLSAWKFLFG